MSIREDEQVAREILYRLGRDRKDIMDEVQLIVPFFERVRADLRAELQDLKEERDQKDRAQLIRDLVGYWKLTHEEALRFVDERHPFTMEHGPCRACNGRGVQEESACMGVKYVKCGKCHGRNSGRVLRLRLPWSPSEPEDRGPNGTESPDSVPA